MNLEPYRLVTGGRKQHTDWAHLTHRPNGPRISVCGIGGSSRLNHRWRMPERKMATCRMCLLGARMRGVDVSEWEPMPYELSIETDQGFVDMVAVDRALDGKRTELTRAERYMLVGILADRVPFNESAPGDRDAFNPLVELAANALGVTSKQVVSMINARRRSDRNNTERLVQKCSIAG